MNSTISLILIIAIFRFFIKFGQISKSKPRKNSRSPSVSRNNDTRENSEDVHSEMTNDSGVITKGKISENRKRDEENLGRRRNTE